MFKRPFVIFSVGAALLSGAAFAQEDYTAYKSEVAAQAMGSFVKQTTQDSVKQEATNSSGVIGTYRFWFNRHNGVEGNYAWTQNTEKYNRVGVDSNLHEISAAYVFRMPMKRFSLFVLGGAGTLVFDPRNSTAADTQTRAAFVYGAGADINLTDHLFVRGEYRGLVYNSPTYELADFKGLDRVTHRAEPTVGFGFRF